MQRLGPLSLAAMAGTVLAVSCTRDWDRFDPSLAPATSSTAASGGGGASSSSTVSSSSGSGGGGFGGMGGAGGTGGAGGAPPSLPIFRSVGPGNAQALALGTGNALTITGTTASFATALPDNVGAGDVLQYDTDDDGDVDGDDALAFIVARTSASEFEVSNASGGLPTAVAGDGDWSLFRAYSSLADAVAGSENPAVALPLRDFDSWVGGNDLVALDKAWNITCYADAIDFKPVFIDGWTTTPARPLRIFAPRDTSLVGVSQRHDGTAGTGYVLNTSSAPPPLAHVIDVRDDNVELRGIEITGWLNADMDNSWEGVHVDADGTLLDGLLIHDDEHPGFGNPNSDGINLNAMQDGWKVTIRNTVVYNISRGGINYQGAGAPVAIIENTTVANTGITMLQADDQGGIAFAGGSLSIVTVTNTISVGSQSGADFTKLGDNWGTSSNNISSDASAPGAGSQTAVTAASLFLSTTLGSEDFHLDGGVAAVDTGKDIITFDIDIDGDTRPAGAWDVGADERP